MWTECGNGVYVATYTGPYIASVVENGKNMQPSQTLSGIVPGQYYYDYENNLLYVATTNGYNPDSGQSTYMLYTWLGFCNSGSSASYKIQGLYDIPYRPALDNQSIPPLNQSISELFSSIIATQFGQIKINDPEWGFNNISDYIWENATIYIKSGIEGAPYPDFIDIFVGYIEKVILDEKGLIFGVKDMRARDFKTIPTEKMLKGEFPDIDADAHYQPKPVLFGEKKGIRPPCVDIKKYTYLISQTEFSGELFYIESIDAVYVGNSKLSVTEYTVNLSDGTFTLVSSPGESIVSCDAKGLKIDVDFSTGYYTGTYSTNIADISFFIMNKLVEIEEEKFDLLSFSKLKDLHVWSCGDWLCKETDFLTEYLPVLQITGVFHLNITADGKISVLPYSRTEKPEIGFSNINIREFQLERNSKEILSAVLLRFDRIPDNNRTETDAGDKLSEYRYLSEKDISVQHKFKISKTKNFRSILTDHGDVTDLAKIILNFEKKRPLFITFQTNSDGFSIHPLQKISFSYDIIKANGNIVKVFSDEPFVVMHVNKSIAAGVVTIIARRDLTQIHGLCLLDHYGRVLLNEDGKALLT